MKILTIIGARPQFIKAAAVSRAVEEFNKNSIRKIEEVIVHTGQHFDKNMSDVFFEEMGIPSPKYNLGINNLSHGAMTGRMMEGIELCALKEKPDWILVYGDTNSTLAASLVASKLHIKLAHVEAGLRSFNNKMPEEINRILTDRVSNLLFCPTQIAVDNLLLEGFENYNCSIYNVGDVMYDSAIYYNSKKYEPQIIIPSEYILTTIHRAENTNSHKSLSGIISALNSINKEVPVVLAIHPRTRKYIDDYKLNPNFSIIDPVGYLDMIYLIKNSSLIMTDSGGLQKEAYFFEKKCITLREETEWLELVSNGYNILVGSDFNKILDAFQNTNKLNNNFSLNLFGDGNASNKIVNHIFRY